MADKRLWKDLVVARLRVTKWVCECAKSDEKPLYTISPEQWATPLSAAEAPAGYPYKNSRWGVSWSQGYNTNLETVFKKG